MDKDLTCEKNNQIRGAYFERIFTLVLKIDPLWKTIVKRFIPKQKDIGVDHWFEDYNGNIWAVQCKFISPSEDIRKAEIDSFLSASSSSNVYKRLLIATTDGIGNARMTLDQQEKEVVCFLRKDFQQSAVIFPDSPDELGKGVKRKIYVEGASD